MSAPLAGRRIGLLTASASRLGGGVFEAVVAQAALIRSLGGEAQIFALADRHTEEDRARFGPSPVIATPVIGPSQVGYSPSLHKALALADLDGTDVGKYKLIEKDATMELTVRCCYQALLDTW